MPLADDWELEPTVVQITPETVCLALEKKFRKSIVDRGFTRYRRCPPVEIDANAWLVRGFSDLGDTYEQYRVTLNGRRYDCSCYGTPWGDSRQHRVCSHVMAVIIHRKLGGFAPKPPGGYRFEDAPAGDLDDGLSSTGFPSPGELGLPEKFARFRGVQVEALKKILDTQARWILVGAPTGTGKSLLAAAVQKLLQTRMLYTCTTLDLQDQFCRDFPYAVELKGRENYPTANLPERFPEINCGMCTKGGDNPRCRWCCPPECYADPPCTGRKCTTGERGRRCPYERRKAAALAASLAVVNVALFLNEANYVGGFSGWPLVTLDEADLVESALMSFIELSVSSRLIEKLGLEPPARKTVEAAWVEWLDTQGLPKVAGRLAELEGARADEVISLGELRELNELKRIKAKLDFFRNSVGSSTWANCTEDMENGPWVWRPVYVADFADHYLWRHAERWLLMSATILSPDQFCRNLGIPQEKAEYVELPSLFPVEHRPVFYIPHANMTKKTESEEWPKALEALDRILDVHPHEKTLVHTVSYALARYVAGHSRHTGRMVIYNSAKERGDVVEEFRRSPLPLVIVAPSLERGIDLVGDLCRVIVIMKVPYRSLGDEQVRKRLYGSRDGQGWYTVDAIRTIVQMAGRGVRNEQDWCRTYVVDRQFGRLLKEWRQVFPRWWREAVKTVMLDQLEDF